MTIVGDRPADIEAALRFMAEQRMDVVLTSGGLGPTADDLTAEVVGELPGPRDGARRGARRSASQRSCEPLAKRWPNLDREAIRTSTRKQATDPERRDGARTRRHGARPGGAVRSAASGPTIVVLPGPPRELQPMWRDARRERRAARSARGATHYRRRTLRLFGIPESEIAETLRVAEREGVELERLEITTCLKRGEIEVVTRYEPDAEDVYEAFAGVVRERHADTLFSQDGSSIDEQVAALLRGASTIATRASRARAGCWRRG